MYDIKALYEASSVNEAIELMRQEHKKHPDSTWMVPSPNAHVR